MRDHILIAPQAGNSRRVRRVTGILRIAIATIAVMGLVLVLSMSVAAQESVSPTPSQGTVEPTPTIPPEFNNNPLGGTEGDFDSRALGISVVVGLIFAFGLYLVWRLVRPDNPTFGGRSRGG